jgi:hypothetical protein
MEEQHRVKVLVAGAALGGLALGGLFAGPTLAGAVQGEDDTTTTAPTSAEGDGEVAPEGCGPRGPGGPGGRGLEAAAEELGMEVDALREALAGGQTLAEVADGAGVAVEDLVAAMVAEATEHLDAAVEAGRLTEEQAAEMADGLEERVQARIDGELPAHVPGGPGGPGRGPGRPGGFGEGGPEAPAEDAEG